MLKTWRPRLDNWVRYRPLPQSVLAVFFELRSALCSAHDAAWLHDACAAARCAPTDLWMQRIERGIKRRLDALPSRVPWSWQPAPETQVEVNKSAILKPWSADEKGVIFISFESQWEKLLRLGDTRLATFAAEYELVVAPTWSPPHSVTNLVFPRLFPGSLPCTISHITDLAVLPRLHPAYRPVQLFASSWVNPALYQPQPQAERDIDLLMVANFGRYKRHHALFAALAAMPRQQRPRVTLIGQPHGDRTAEVLQREMQAHGVRDCITLLSRVSDPEVADALCRSKAAIITSLREGSCVAVVEAMMANTPVALLRGAHIGSSAFLNEQTGRWLDGDDLARDLRKFIDEAAHFSPRDWLLRNGVDCHSSTRVLNEHLRSLANEAGRPWTRDLAAHHWRPDPVLLDAEAIRIASSERERIKERFGLILH